MIRTALCDLLGIKYPIIQGGMSWVSTWELASAVSQAGALGQVAAGNAPPEWVREQIHQMGEHTDKPFGVNIAFISPFIEEVVELCIEEKVAVVTTGGGNPGPYVHRFIEGGIIFVPVVASVALAKRLERMGAAAIVAEGLESGGHIGQTATMPLVPQIVDAAQVPVVAAGGIADGRGFAAALALGAAGIQMGTRFICTEECTVHIRYKERIIRAHDRATTTTGHSIGHPVRAIRNPFVHRFAHLELEGASDEEIVALGTGALRLAVVEGDMERGSIMAGQICGMISNIRPVKDVIEGITAQAEEIIARLPSLVVQTDSEQ